MYSLPPQRPVCVCVSVCVCFCVFLLRFHVSGVREILILDVLGCWLESHEKIHFSANSGLNITSLTLYSQAGTHLETRDYSWILPLTPILNGPKGTLHSAYGHTHTTRCFYTNITSSESTIPRLNSASLYDLWLFLSYEQQHLQARHYCWILSTTPVHSLAHTC